MADVERHSTERDVLRDLRDQADLVISSDNPLSDCLAQIIGFLDEIGR
jgi:hypothetical protein